MISPVPAEIDVYSKADTESVPLGEVLAAVRRFITWLDSYGETSYDFQTLYASDLCRSAKALYYCKPFLGTVAVAPIIFCEAFIPSARKLFWKPQRFPIADAHYAMGFALLGKYLNDDVYYRRALHFLQELEETRCSGYEHYCWGYPFDWETRGGTMRSLKGRSGSSKAAADTPMSSPAAAPRQAVQPLPSATAASGSSAPSTVSIQTSAHRSNNTRAVSHSAQC